MRPLSVAGCMALAVVAVAVACAPLTEEKRATVESTPSLQAYDPVVNDFLVKRCATLDCHGQSGRALRLYSRRGLRRIESPPIVDVDNPIFDAATYDAAARASSLTKEEVRDNFEAVVGLQPELMSQVIEHRADADDLLLVRKPRDLAERHKGGHFLTRGDPGDTCVRSWLAGAVEVEQCRRAALGPGP